MLIEYESAVRELVYRLLLPKYGGRIDDTLKETQHQMDLLAITVQDSYWRIRTEALRTNEEE